MMLLGYSGVYIFQFFKKKKHLKSGNLLKSEKKRGQRKGKGEGNR